MKKRPMQIRGIPKKTAPPVLNTRRFVLKGGIRCKYHVVQNKIESHSLGVGDKRHVTHFDTHVIEYVMPGRTIHGRYAIIKSESRRDAFKKFRLELAERLNPQIREVRQRLQKKQTGTMDFETRMGIDLAEGDKVIVSNMKGEQYVLDVKTGSRITIGNKL